MVNWIYRKLLLAFGFAIVLISVSGAASFAAPGLGAEQLAGMNPAVRLLVLYGVGLGLALTPCVYPMIGVTLGYFSSQKGFGGKRSALLAAVYVLGIAITYSIFGTIAGLTGSLFGSIMQNTWVVGGISLLLVALAFSMFGFYEIRPPAALANKSSARSGIAGALIMGLIFGLVAGPCVAPVIVGLLAFIAQTGSAAIGFSSFFFVALGMGTPLFVLAIFAAQMPTPGIWMTAINKIAGFLLLFVAAYFAKPLLSAAVGNVLYPLILVVAGLYLGFFSKELYMTSRMKTFFTVLGTALVVAGLFYYLPVQPRKDEAQALMPAEGTEARIETAELEWVPYSEEKLQEAVNENKPVMLDFYADWCGVCQEYENVTFKNAKFLEAVDGVVTLRVDATDRGDDAIMGVIRKYGVQGLPSIIFIDKTGKQSGDMVVGIVPDSELIKRLEKIKND